MINPTAILHINDATGDCQIHLIDGYLSDRPPLGEGERARMITAEQALGYYMLHGAWRFKRMKSYTWDAAS